MTDPSPAADTANAAMRRYWNEVAGPRWVERAELQEARNIEGAQILLREAGSGILAGARGRGEGWGGGGGGGPAAMGRGGLLFDSGVRLGGRPRPQPPHAPGPMALSDPDYVRGVLRGAGFTAIAVEPARFH